MLAPRVFRVLERQQHVDPVITNAKPSAEITAKEFIEAYDAAQLFQTEKILDMENGRRGTYDLYRKISAWKLRIEQDIPGFDSNMCQGRPDSPDKVIGDAERLIALVEQYKESGNELAYADVLLEKIGGALAVAQEEWSEAQNTLVHLQELQSKVREKGNALQKELVCLRGLLRNVLGSNHLDYQKLRSGRIKEDHRKDNETAETSESTVDGQLSSGSEKETTVVN